MLDAFESATGSEAEKIISTGGATQNEFWMQNKADITGKEIEVPAIEEATPLGAAIISGIGIGIYQNEFEAHKATYHIGSTYKPNIKNKGLYDEYYKIFKKLYFDLKEINISIYEKFKK
jgi:sugar (pentulose or hexulose) kinase